MAFTSGRDTMIMHDKQSLILHIKELPFPENEERVINVLLDLSCEDGGSPNECCGWGFYY